ncbi:hypothetical protein [Endozoicomonas sp. 4G]|nr:hypothetical protein [Endozoicomonas sp. 4G]
MKDKIVLILAAVMLLAVVKFDDLEVEADTGGFKLRGRNGSGDS